MPSSLGLFIEEDVIKYAKVTKERDNIKVESFGMKFYDKLSEAVQQIVSETFSYKIPISVNILNENYNYFHVFSLLNKNDMPKAITTEFDSICAERQYNQNALETRYALVANPEDKEKLKVIHVSVNKTEILKRTQQLEETKISGLYPISLGITSILDIKAKENVMVINMEESTTITTIINSNIDNVETMEEGSKEVLDAINLKENSYSKAYEICKNTTIYTKEGKELEEEESQYLEYIMPTLYKIVTKVKDMIADNVQKIDKIYLTGTLSVINNVDLYFSENLADLKCEILKPYFINKSSTRINVKDYVEVNSAIALALQQLDAGIRGMNFKKENLWKKLPDIMNMEVGKGAKVAKPSKGKSSNKINFHIRNDLGEKLDATERWLLRGCAGFLILVICYTALSGFLTNQMKKKDKEVQAVIDDTKSEIALIENDITKVNSKTSSYKAIIQKLEAANNALAEKYQLKNAIPVLLNQIMSAIPKGVQLASIQNTTARHIKIIAQTEEYDQLGYFKAEIINGKILNDVVSDQGVKEGNIIKMTIEGELP